MRVSKHVVRRNDCRGEGVPKTRIGKIVKLDDVAHAIGGAGSGASESHRVGGAAVVEQSDCDLEFVGFAGSAPDANVLQAQVEAKAEIIALCQYGAERKKEEAVRVRRIPSDFEVLIRRIPLKQRSVSEDTPTVLCRVSRKIF